MRAAPMLVTFALLDGLLVAVGGLAPAGAADVEALRRPVLAIIAITGIGVVALAGLSLVARLLARLRGRLPRAVGGLLVGIAYAVATLGCLAWAALSFRPEPPWWRWPAWRARDCWCGSCGRKPNCARASSMRRAQDLPRVACLLALAALAAGCDIVRDRYGTLEDARADRLFERGWLPDLLPASATDIHTANNLDISTSVGRFDYRVGDDDAMLAAMEAGAPANAPFDDWAYVVATRRKDGRLPWTYRGDDATWVFFCDRVVGRCETWMWSR